MAEGGGGTFPQVFVVDSQASFLSLPSPKKTRWTQTSQKLLLLLVGLAMLGLVVEGCFIYQLYKKTEMFSLRKSNPLCQNLTSSKTSAQQGGVIKIQAGSDGHSNEIPTGQPHLEQIQKKPFAHLMCSSNPVGEENVVQWENKDGDVITYLMGYNKGRLIVEKEGYYYIYSKVQFNAAECSLTQHKVMKDTEAYGKSIELMKSKNFRCCACEKPSGGDILLGSFLAGIFHLRRGDQIFVTLEKIQKLHPGPKENFMGAFMISP